MIYHACCKNASVETKFVCEPGEGIEPSTSFLPRMRSTTELPRQYEELYQVANQNGRYLKLIVLFSYGVVDTNEIHGNLEKVKIAPFTSFPFLWIDLCL